MGASAPVTSADPVGPAIVVRADAPSSAGWRELVEHRELLLVLARREVTLRYRHTVLGVAWVVLQPLLAATVFTLVFSRVVPAPTGCPYPLYLLAGLIPWQLFAHGLSHGSQSLTAQRGLITKVYFPRAVVPLATLLAAHVDMAVGLGLFAAGMAWYGVAPTSLALTLPLALLAAGLATAGVTLWLSALTVRFRDLRHVLPFLTQLWFFATPVLYPAALVPERWRPLLALNPLTAAVDAFRLALLGVPVDPGALLLSGTSAAVFLGTGALVFRRLERTLADAM